MIKARAQHRSTEVRIFCARRRVVLGVAIAAALWGSTVAHAANPAAAVDAASGAMDASADASASGADASFDRSLLSGAGNNTTDLARFEHGNPVMAGTYNTDIYLNSNWVGRRDVRFAARSEQASATPCIDTRMLNQLGLHLATLTPELIAQLKDPSACLNIASVIPGATAVFDMGDLRLDVSVPQIYLSHAARGYVSPAFWDEGVPAGLLNYNFNSYHSSSQGLSQTSSYLSLNAGFNIGPWHLRQDSTLTWQSATSSSRARHNWQNIDSYVQRDIPSLRAQLTVGDSFTDGQVFDSFGLRGVQLATDDRMLADSVRGYAPVVRGVANTNARVSVRQNGVEIYQTTVAPGPFAINDLYPTGYGGNLDVTITEADGRTRSFSVPYASVAQLLRPGTTRFDIAAGQLRDLSILHQPDVAQATIQHGFSNLLTGYAGIEGSQGYVAALLGSAINTRYGAVAFDITQSHANIPGFSTHSGHSMRLSYSKILPQTDTSLTVAAYRYSTAGYLSLADAALARDYARRGLDAFQLVQQSTLATNGVPTLLTPAQQAALAGTIYNPIINTTGLQRQRNRFDITLNQRLGNRGGSLYANASASDYWNRKGTDTQFQLGYNNQFHHVSYSVSATRSSDAYGHYRNEYNLTFTLPLGDGGHAPTFALNLNRSQDGSMQDQAMVSGALGADNQFSYGATASHGSAGNEGSGTGNSGSVNGGYRSPYAVFNASFGGGNGYSQASLGVSGAVVAHPGGVTFGQSMGDTVGIVYAPGAEGARLVNASGVRVDRFGYAIVPYLTPYNPNTIQLDPKGLPLDVQLDATSAQVTPHAGAVVMLKFKTENGRTVIMRTRLQNGQNLPFGAELFNEKGTSMGVVGGAGKVLVRGVEQSGKLTARWQDDSGTVRSCSFDYHLKPKDSQGQAIRSLEQISIICATSTAETVSRTGK